MPSCPHCGEDMPLVDTPSTVFNIGIGPFRLELQRWSKHPWCMDCASREDNERAEAIAESSYYRGMEDGYREAKANAEYPF